MQKGEEAIREYCRQREYADFVIEGGLDRLIRTWELVVKEIAGGYRSMVYEYINDMDGRRIIHEVWPLASSEQLFRYQGRLKEADKRFFEATVPVREGIWGAKTTAKKSYQPEIHWWYYRVPKDKGPNW